MKNMFVFGLISVGLFLSGCSTEDWDRIDRRVGGHNFDIISEPDPYANTHDDEEDDKK